MKDKRSKTLGASRAKKDKRSGKQGASTAKKDKRSKTLGASTAKKDIEGKSPGNIEGGQPMPNPGTRRTRRSARRRSTEGRPKINPGSSENPRTGHRGHRRQTDARVKTTAPRRAHPTISSTSQQRAGRAHTALTQDTSAVAGSAAAEG
ncbi:hypothetical protein NDU88_012867 [Pleurodeles waltl]|uniref:Uncharacterized protein n=1 Tax=Pleurodeles waltl TaxID=8319 RepID=A0AAV7R411_PLEWA|nr:hypothetical protein NDU88_012867 [Pleurodeles waltl]